MSNKELITSLFNKPKVIILTADINSGKSMTIYHLIKLLREYTNFNFVSYGLRVDLGEQKIYSLEEVEQLKNTIFFADEFVSLFDVEDRKKRKEIEKTLRLLFHNNNILVLCGVGENFKKFLSSKAEVIIYKKSTISDFINGSRIKNVCLNYSGNEKGSTLLNIPLNKALVYNGSYKMIDIPYYPEYDTKKDNIALISLKSENCAPICANNVLNNVENAGIAQISDEELNYYIDLDREVNNGR